MKREYTKKELEVLVINFLFRRGRWGNYYFPLTTLVNWLSKAIKNNGKYLIKSIKELIKKEIIMVHKRGKAISLNPYKKEEIERILE